MNSFVFLVPIAFLFGVIALTSFLWSVRAGRFDEFSRVENRVRLKDRHDH